MGEIFESLLTDLIPLIWPYLFAVVGIIILIFGIMIPDFRIISIGAVIFLIGDYGIYRRWRRK